jgi:hypothetical protein
MGKLNFRRVLAAEGIDGYWSGAEQQAIKPAVSDADRTQAAITLHDISGPEAKEVTLTAKGSASLPGGTAQETLSVTLWKDGNAWLLNLFGRKDTFSAFAIAASTFDLRIAARRRTSRRAGGNGALYAWYEILILARPDGGDVRGSGHWAGISYLRCRKRMTNTQDPPLMGEFQMLTTFQEGNPMARRTHSGQTSIDQVRPSRVEQLSDIASENVRNLSSLVHMHDEGFGVSTTDYSDLPLIKEN